MQQQNLAQQQIKQLNELKPLVEELETEVQSLEDKHRHLNQRFSSKSVKIGLTAGS